MFVVNKADLTDELKVYDLNSSRAKRLRVKNCPRMTSFGIAQDNDSVYLVGGNPHGSVYSIDIASGDCWESSRMNFPRLYPAAVVHQGGLYAIGGCRSGCVEETVESVEVITEYTWGYCRPINVARKLAAAVSVGSFIYLAGGIEKTHTLESIEKFDTNSGWVVLQLTLDVPRSRCAVVALDSQKIVLYGGRTVGGERLSAGVEVDFETMQKKSFQCQFYGDFRGKSAVTREARVFKVFTWVLDSREKTPTEIRLPIAPWDMRKRLLKLRMMLK
jgi:hypothetical protein